MGETKGAHAGSGSITSRFDIKIRRDHVSAPTRVAFTAIQKDQNFCLPAWTNLLHPHRMLSHQTTKKRFPSTKLRPPATSAITQLRFNLTSNRQTVSEDLLY